MPERVPPPIAARGALALRRLLLRAADRVVPPEIALLDGTLAFTRTRVLGALAEAGVVEELAQGRAAAAELAARLGLDRDVLHRVLRAAAVHGVVRLDRRGRFRLTSIGRALTEDHPRSLRAWTRYLNLDSTQDAWAGVGRSLETGDPAFPAVHGRSVWEHLAAHPHEERLFATSMRKLSAIVVPAVVARYPWPEEGVVCDVAGGVGPVLAGVLGARPRLRGVLVDAAGVLAEAETHLEAAGVRSRVTLTEGDMFKRIDARADVYVLKDVLHDWDDERCLAILRTVRAAMPAGARVVLVEALQDRNRVEPITSVVDLHMLTQCDGGRQRSVAELNALLRAAGLRPGEVRHTGGPALVEGIAA